MLDDQEIKRLLLRTAAREANAFETLYRKSAPLLMGVAMRVVRRREVAEEVLHDSFTKIWRSADRFDPVAAQPVAWMVAIVRNRALDVMASHDVSRVDSIHAQLDDDPDGSLDRLFDWSPPADDAIDADRLNRWLRQCLSELQAAERQAIVLAYEHGLSHGDLAAHLSKPLGTVKTWVRRGLAHLRQCVERQVGDMR